MERRHVFPTLADLSTAVSGLIARDTAQAKAEGRRYSIALSGGSTPRALHETMVSALFTGTFCWDAMEFFFGDERMVPPDHSNSNYHMAFETLFSRAPIAPQQIHRMKGEMSAAVEAATEYEDELRRHLPTVVDGFPQFDLVLLGLGADGHIASLFPDTDILDEQHKWVAAAYVGKFRTWRMSLTFPVINRARKIFVLVTGENKADVVASLFNNGLTTQLPAQRLAPLGELHWFLDSKAAKNVAGMA